MPQSSPFTYHPLQVSPEEALDEAERIADIESKERAKDKEAMARQAHVEWLANNGLDGPRPCMYNGGKRC